MSPRPTRTSAIVLRESAARIAEESSEMLRGVAYNAGARDEQIDDAVQQGFAQLMSAFPGDPAHVVGIRRYLVRCVQSSVWKIQRTDGRRQRWLVADDARDRLERRAGDGARAEGMDLGEPIERVLAQEALAGARDLLQQLPEEWAAVLLLKAAGYGTAEIGERLGLSTRQVRSASRRRTPGSTSCAVEGARFPSAGLLWVVAPFERALSERRCDLAGALAAMHELVGSEVSVSVLGARSPTSEAMLAFSGRVERGLELGPRPNDAVAFEVAGVLICISERILEGAWRCAYAVGAERWLAVGLRSCGGTEVEIDEVPDPEAPEPLA
jgi:RNA polymerase sigma factor (sigma-70 family)